VEDICINGEPAISLRPRSIYDELAKLLIMIHNRFIDSPDADEIVIIAEDEIAVSKVFQVHHEARTAGFFKIKLAIINP
jgi:biopolymer transport protein ExbD